MNLSIAAGPPFHSLILAGTIRYGRYLHLGMLRATPVGELVLRWPSTIFTAGTQSDPQRQTLLSMKLLDTQT